MSAVISSLTRDSIGPDLRDAEGAAVIDVWGPQCAPCLALAPTFEKLAETYEGRARFFKLEAPSNRMACVDLKVVSLPTFLFFSGGSEQGRLTGDVSHDKLETWINEQIATIEAG